MNSTHGTARFIPRRRLLASAALLSLAPFRARADYSLTNTFDLNPTSGFTSSLITGIFATHLSGNGIGSATASSQHALFWNGFAPVPTDLSPSIPPAPGVSFARDAAGMFQAGYANNASTGFLDHAMLWSGTAAPIDLNPLGYTSSQALGAAGSQQVGFAANATSGQHAYLWAGSSAGTDLNPSGFSNTIAAATDGIHQVGYGSGVNSSGNTHALLWAGAAAAIDLNPAGFTSSSALGVSGAQQVGSGYGTNTTSNTHALLWSGSAASVLDLNPVGFTSSTAFDTNGSRQVGFGYGATTSFAQHALLWAGSNSAVDLHSFVPGSPSASVANSIDPYGNIAGYAVIAAQSHAVVWLNGDAQIAGPWNASSNWTAGIPTLGDVLLIGDARTVPYASANPAILLGNLTVDGSYGGLITLQQNQDTLSTATESIGFIGAGAFTQSAGTHNVTTLLTLAAKPGSSGTYTLSGGTLNSPNVIINTGGTFLFQNGSWNLSSLTLNGSASVLFSPTARVIKLNSLSLAHTASTYSARLNLADGAAIVQTSSTNKTATLSSLADALRSGRNSGTWTGNGISSSAAAADPFHYTLGLFDNAFLGKTSFNGQPVDANSLIVSIALLGDANRNGIVDIQDLSVIANNWQKSRNSWSSGDLNYDGIVDISDFTLVAIHWQQSSSFPLAGSSLSMQSAALAANTPSPVPEPSPFALLLSAAALLWHRPSAYRRSARQTVISWQ